MARVLFYGLERDPRAHQHSMKHRIDIYQETVIEAVRTGFLFGHSLNFYEDHNTPDELIEQGYSEIQVEIANRVLAHFGTGVGANLGRCPEELWSVTKCADCGLPLTLERSIQRPPTVSSMQKRTRRQAEMLQVRRSDRGSCRGPPSSE